MPGLRRLRGCAVSGRKEGEGCMVATFFTMLILSPLVAFWRAFVLSKLWGWYLVPLGLPPISKLQAFGLTWIAFLLTSRNVSAQPAGKGASDLMASWLATVAVMPGAALLFGWLAWRLFA